MKIYKHKTLRHYNLPEHYHEITFSCYHGYSLLKRERSCVWFSEAIEIACKAHNVVLLAYVLMPNHVHLIIKPKNQHYNVASFLQSIKVSVARKARIWLEGNDPKWIDKLTECFSNGKKRFHFWQPGGGYDRNITNQETLIEMINYIHNNPVRKGLIDSPTQWKWSSASFYENGIDGPIIIQRPDF